MKKLLVRTLCVIPVLSLALVFTGCETTEGAGRDIEKLGDSIEDSAKDAK